MIAAGWARFNFMVRGQSLADGLHVMQDSLPYARAVKYPCIFD